MPVLRIMACGSVDDGKSTLLGQLLLAASAVPDDVLASLQGSAHATGSRDSAIDPSFLLDGLIAEREQRITIDIAWRTFMLGERRVVLADVPGHQEYTQNMATAASLSDVALVIVDARAGLTDQTHRHLRILRWMGKRVIYLLVNKMDLVGYREDAYRTVVDEYAVRYRSAWDHEFHAMPVVATTSENVATPSPNMPWWGGEPLVQVLLRREDKLETPDGTGTNAHGTALVHLPLISPDGERWYGGEITGGTVRVGTAYQMLPGLERVTVERIMTPQGEQESADRGEVVTLRFDRELAIDRGSCLTEDPNWTSLPDHVGASLLWLGVNPGHEGGRYRLVGAAGTALGTITTLQTDAPARAPSDVRRLETTEARISLTHAAPLRSALQDLVLGRLLVVDPVTNETVGLAQVTDASGSTGERTRPGAPSTAQEPARLATARPHVIWLTGLPASGKTTIARALQALFTSEGVAACVLDGDELRGGLNRDLGFTASDRAESVRRTAEVARLIADAGLHVIVALVSPYASDRARAQEIVGPSRFIEVFVDTPVSVCEARDPKGLYRRARTGALRGMTGVDDPYERPAHPAIVIDDATSTPSESAHQIAETIRGANHGPE